MSSLLSISKPAAQMSAKIICIYPPTHITPGVNDAVLERDKTHGIVGSLNDTAIAYPSGGLVWRMN